MHRLRRREVDGPGRAASSSTSASRCSIRSPPTRSPRSSKASVQRGTGTVAQGGRQAARRQDRHDERRQGRVVRRLLARSRRRRLSRLRQAAVARQPATAGGSYAAPIFRDFMQMALKDKPATPFRVPPGIKLIRVSAASACAPARRGRRAPSSRPSSPARRRPTAIASSAARRLPASPRRPARVGAGPAGSTERRRSPAGLVH